MHNATSELEKYYAARAPEYDQVYAKPERQNDLREMERWLPPQLSGRRVLELACGTGYWTQLIAAVARRIVAIDAAPQTLEIARKRIHQGDVSFLVGDAYDVSPEVGEFDAAFAGFWFSHVPRSRQQEFLLSLDERLEPGAHVILLDNLYTDDSSTLIAERDSEGNTYQRRALGDGTVHRVLKNFPTERELRSLVDPLGRDAQFIRWQYYWALSYVTAQR
ncbi:MAG TPA: methyltransferase domain-containing protein [Steroidobacteraceae bacterium]|nr:methyltransferase domain-containing protein [Steroidobacteraceae bacterium]